MSTIKKILVPLDFSDAALAAEQRAEELARTVGAELILLHVVDDTPLMLVGDAGYLPATAFEAYEAEAKQRLERQVQRVTEAALTAQSSLVHGRPAQAIVSAAEKAGADLIVMGTHGRRGFRHLLMGSVAEGVVRTSKIPVMTVRGEAPRA